MNKYYFVNIGAEVIWHPVNSDEQKVMQVCTSAPHPVENDTLVSLIFSDKKGNVKVVIKNKERIHFSNNFKIRHFIFIRVCSLTNKCIEMKIRIGRSFDKETNEVFYQLQFKLDGERTYNAYSYDVFKEESDAKEALNKHLNGEREYTYFVSIEKVKRTIKGNRVDVKKVLAFHVMSAKSDLPGSRIWVKIN